MSNPDWFEEISFPEMEFEDDRVFTNFQFRGMTFEDAMKRGVFDVLSLLFSDKDLMLVLATTSNFSFAPFEVRSRLAGLADETGILSQADLIKIQSGSKLMGEVTLLSDKLGLTSSQFGVATFPNNKRVLKRRVSFLSTDAAFTLTYIASNLLVKYGEVFDFPTRTESKINGGNFTLQLAVLQEMLMDPLGEVSMEKMHELSAIIRASDQSVMKKLVMDPLLKAGFIEIEGEIASISIKDVVVDQPQSPLRDYLIDIIKELGEDGVNLKIPYPVLSKLLEEKWNATLEGNVERKRIPQKVALFLLYLKQRGYLNIQTKWQMNEDEIVGKAGRYYRYRISDEGRQFINYIKEILQNPTQFLGDPEKYYSYRDNRLLDFSELSYEYQTILMHLTQRVFK